MTLALDSISSAPGPAATGTSLSWSHTCAAGATGLAVMAGNSTNKHATGITYNGVALSSVTSVAQGTTACSELWQIANPSAGANTVAIAFSGSARFCGGAISVTGGDATTPCQNSATSVNNSGSWSDGGSGANTGDIPFGVISSAKGDTVTITGMGANSGTTQINITSNTGAGLNTVLFGVNTLGGTSHPAGGFSATLNWAFIQAVFVQAGGGGGGGGSGSSGVAYYTLRRRR